jgi:hypothetical protein
MPKQSRGFTSHDVRKLHVCDECGKLGASSSALATRIDTTILMKTGRQSWMHPGCMRIEHLVLLSREQLGEIRLCDVDARTMETILLAFGNGLKGRRGV